MIFYVSKDSEANSIYKASAGSFGNKEVLTRNGITLERFLTNNEVKFVDLLKLDIEGAEIDILKSTINDNLCKMKQSTIKLYELIKSFTSYDKVKKIQKK